MRLISSCCSFPVANGRSTAAAAAAAEQYLNVTKSISQSKRWLKTTGALATTARLFMASPAGRLVTPFLQLFHAPAPVVLALAYWYVSLVQDISRFGTHATENQRPA